MRGLIVALFVVVTTLGCRTTAANSTSSTGGGFDIDGNRRSCNPISPGTVCTQIFTIQDQFAADCNDQGFRSTKCGCHDYICSGSVKSQVKGYDIMGTDRTCAPMDVTQVLCSAQFTPEDQFAQDCNSSGGTATACGCHDYICSKDLKSSGSKQVSGYGMNGKKRSCTPAPANQICTMVATLEDGFGSKCRSKGYKATKCGCHSWICSNKL